MMNTCRNAKLDQVQTQSLEPRTWVNL